MEEVSVWIENIKHTEFSKCRLYAVLDEESVHDFFPTHVLPKTVLNPILHLKIKISIIFSRIYAQIRDYSIWNSWWLSK